VSEEEERVAIARTLQGAWNARDTSVLSELVDPDFRFMPAIAGQVDEHGVSREELPQFLTELDETWEKWEIEAREYHPVGERTVLILSRVHAVGRGSGIEFDRDLHAVVRFRDGKAVELRSFLDLDEAKRYADEKEHA
jgi:ketosteroid isomerase-like protein